MRPATSRIVLFPQYDRYSGETAVRATEKYHKLAKENGLSMTQMALAFVNSRPFVTSNIIGATSMEQLKQNIGSIDLKLGDEVLKGIEEIHDTIPNPAP
jgi:aryl-alcohol dehydrogenase-like predicted oxidoreductase